DHRIPHHRTRLHVERQQVRVERVHEQLVAEYRTPAIDAAEADVHALGQIAAIRPQLAAAARVDGPRGVVGTGDVHHAVGDDRRRLEVGARIGLERPRYR